MTLRWLLENAIKSSGLDDEIIVQDNEGKMLKTKSVFSYDIDNSRLVIHLANKEAVAS